MAVSKKKGGHASLQGKKPSNSAKVRQQPYTRNPGHITNKLKRSEMYGKYLLEKKKQKRASRIAREKQAEALGEDAPASFQLPEEGLAASWRCATGRRDTGVEPRRSPPRARWCAGGEVVRGCG